LNEDCSGIVIADVEYCIGEEISIFSLLSQESFQGIITAVSMKDVIVRSSSGIRFSFQLNQIRHGRVILSKGEELLQIRETVMQQESSIQNQTFTDHDEIGVEEINV
jgi:hypothetical protein